jgi:hypothetical protein
MQNAIAEDSSGKPDAWKLARPVWGWGLAVMPALHHKRTFPDDNGKPNYAVRAGLAVRTGQAVPANVRG